MPTIISDLKARRPSFPPNWNELADSRSSVIVDSTLADSLQGFRQRLEYNAGLYSVAVKELEERVLEYLHYALPGVGNVQAGNVTRPILEGLPVILAAGASWETKFRYALRRQFEAKYLEESQRGGLTGKGEPAEAVLKFIVDWIRHSPLFDTYENQTEPLLEEATKLRESLRLALREVSGFA